MRLYPLVLRYLYCSYYFSVSAWSFYLFDLFIQSDLLDLLLRTICIWHCEEFFIFMLIYSLALIRSSILFGWMSSGCFETWIFSLIIIRLMMKRRIIVRAVILLLNLFFILLSVALVSHFLPIFLPIFLIILVIISYCLVISY